jgi:outer membrane murein-binding lipoprotein Lpp
MSESAPTDRPTTDPASAPTTPRLVAVDPERAAQDTAGGDDRVARPVFLAAAIALAIAVIALIVQSARIEGLSGDVAALEGQVEGLTAEIDAAQRQLEAYGAHRERVKSAVDDLAAQLTLLGDLVASEPVLAPAPPAPTSP